MSEIIDFSEAYRIKKENDQKASLKNMPKQLQDYIQLREIQLNQLENLFKFVKDFEVNRLDFYKNKKLTGPEIDEYVECKMALEIGVDNIKFNDIKVKETYPYAELPTINL